MAFICTRTRNQASIQGLNIQLLIGQSVSTTIFHTNNTGQRLGFGMHMFWLLKYRESSLNQKQIKIF